MKPAACIAAGKQERYCTLKVMVGLIHLLGLLSVGRSTVAVDDVGVAVDDGDSPPRGGGLRWRDLGVSLEGCPSTTTALLLDGYDDAVGSNDHGGRRRDHRRNCLDHSTWLLHPSSGFVEDGSLCGIIGPR